MSTINSQIIATIMKRLPRAMTAAATVEVEHLKLRVGFPYPPSGPPGGDPARRTGWLQRSIHHSQSQTSNTVTEHIIADVPYGEELERGHHDVAPRPFMALTLGAIDQADSQFRGIVNQVLREDE